MKINTLENKGNKGFYKVKCTCGKEVDIKIVIKKTSTHVYSIYINGKENV